MTEMQRDTLVRLWREIAEAVPDDADRREIMAAIATAIRVARNVAGEETNAARRYERASSVLLEASRVCAAMAAKMGR